MQSCPVAYWRHVLLRLHSEDQGGSMQQSNHSKLVFLGLAATF